MHTVMSLTVPPGVMAIHAYYAVPSMCILLDSPVSLLTAPLELKAKALL